MLAQWQVWKTYWLLRISLMFSWLCAACVSVVIFIVLIHFGLTFNPQSQNSLGHLDISYKLLKTHHCTHHKLPHNTSCFLHQHRKSQQRLQFMRRLERFGMGTEARFNFHHGTAESEFWQAAFTVYCLAVLTAQNWKLQQNTIKGSIKNSLAQTHYGSMISSLPAA